MRVLLTRLAVCVLAVAVFFNGPLLRAAFDVQARDAHAHGAVTQAAAADHGAHRHDSGHASADETMHDPQAAGHDHAGAALQCCSMCVVAAPATPAFIPTLIHFDYAEVSFTLARRDLFGHLVALDPDIPKPLV